jgi:hypothetical protein
VVEHIGRKLQPEEGKGDKWDMEVVMFLLYGGIYFFIK